MKTVLIVGELGRIASRLGDLLSGLCAVVQVPDGGAACRYLRAHPEVSVIVSSFRSWRPEHLAALRLEFPDVRRIGLVRRRTRRALLRALQDERLFAILTEAPPDTELIQTVLRALIPVTPPEEHKYRIDFPAESTVAEHQAGPREEDFLLMLSHDVRSAASVIAGYAGMLLEPKKPPGVGSPQILERIRDSSARLIGMIDGIVRITMIANQAALHREPVRPSELIRHASEDLSGSAEARGHTVTQSVGAQDDPRPVDRHLVLLVLRNLLDNAIKYTDPGGRIELKGQSDPDGMTFEVRDNGRGIAPDHLESIFGRLKRFPAGTHEKGSGLGLWVSRKVVELHGGRIWVESALGQGSTFRFTVKAQVFAAPVPDRHEPFSS
jgi:signal transduction histidine kinase